MTKKNALVIGGGGREHALAWSLAKSPKIDCVYVAPGNAGTAIEAGVKNISISIKDFESLSNFAIEKNCILTVIGPEAPLVEGIVNHFNTKGLPCFGPTKQAAQLEGSKAFSKDFLKKYKIPTGSSVTFSKLELALKYIDSVDLPIVIKADGLAAGKGVVIAETRSQAETALKGMLSGSSFGKAGQKVVIEEFLEGEEASFIVMVDGENILPMATSQDHKRIGDGDIGLNTGGMGAYSPAPIIDSNVYDKVMEEIIRPTVRGLLLEETPYRGFLYAGLMIDEMGNPRVIEYNCRLGDPETQPILMRLKSDLAELCLAALEGSLDKISAEWDTRHAIGVVLASKGYPGKYKKDLPISGLDFEPINHTKIFHAGTTLKDNIVVSSGGRVLCVTSIGNTIGESYERCYAQVKRVAFKGATFRKDIAWRALQR